MKKTVAIIVLTLFFFLIYFLQVNFFSWFTISGIKPNLFVIYVVIISLFARKKMGIVFGIIFGLYIDVLNGKILGISSIMLGLIGFIAEYMNKNVSNDTKITMILIVVVNTLIYEIGYYLASIWKLHVSIEIVPFIKIIGVELFFNAIITIIIYPAIQKFGEYISEVFNKKSFLAKYF